MCSSEMCSPETENLEHALACATWSRIAEPADPAATTLVAGLGAAPALRWLRDEALDSSGQVRSSLKPPLPWTGSAAQAIAAWKQASERWAPRLKGMDIRREIDILEKLGGALVVPADPWWPQSLNELEHPPFCLWVRGNPNLLGNSSGDVAPGAGRPTHSLALVGARAASNYGEHIATGMGASLAGRDCTVISGGAYGIDAAAHRGALQTGNTIAVMAGGVDRLYPAGNEIILQQIIRQGALIAEVPPGCAPARHRFLTRNRLIAALAEGTVVVEAAWRSGALNTAHHAQELGRPLGAVPGPVTAMSSAGCHRLLRQGAVCVTDADEAYELVAELGELDPDASKATDPTLASVGLLDGLDGQARLVVDSLPARGNATVDSLAQVSGLSAREVLTTLGLLELDGKVMREGNAWKRASQARRATRI